MTATITYLADRQPISRPLPKVTMPNLVTMVTTLKHHSHKLWGYELLELHHADLACVMGEDADPQVEEYWMRRIHPVWVRVMANAVLSGAAQQQPERHAERAE